MCCGGVWLRAVIGGSCGQGPSCGGGCALAEGTRDARALGAAAGVGSGSGAAVPDRAGRRGRRDEQVDRGGAGVQRGDDVEVAAALRGAPPRRALRRPAAGPAAAHQRRQGRRGDRADPADRAGGGDAPVDSVDGRRGGDLGVVCSSHMEGARAQAAPDWNHNLRPFVWHKTADEIFETLASYLQRIPHSGHWQADVGAGPESASPGRIDRIGRPHGQLPPALDSTVGAHPATMVAAGGDGCEAA